jgi:hypothetical protein
MVFVEVVDEIEQRGVVQAPDPDGGVSERGLGLNWPHPPSSAPLRSAPSPEPPEPPGRIAIQFAADAILAGIPCSSFNATSTGEPAMSRSHRPGAAA